MQTRSLWLLILLLASVVALPAAAEGPSRTADEEAIRAVVEALETAWDKGDGQAFADPFLEDADFTVWNGLRAKGRTAIAEGHKQIFATIYKGTELDMSVQSIRFFGDDTAIALAEGELAKRGPNLPADFPVSRVVPLLVMVRQAGQWRIAAFQNTPVLPMPGGQPAPQPPR